MSKDYEAEDMKSSIVSLIDVLTFNFVYESKEKETVV